MLLQVTFWFYSKTELNQITLYQYWLGVVLLIPLIYLSFGGGSLLFIFSQLYPTSYGYKAN